MRGRPKNICRGGTGVRTQGGASWMNYATCPTCGKKVMVTKSGRLRTHAPLPERGKGSS